MENSAQDRRPSQEIGHVTIQINKKIGNGENTKTTGVEKRFKQISSKSPGTQGHALRKKQVEIEPPRPETANEDSQRQIQEKAKELEKDLINQPHQQLPPALMKFQMRHQQTADAFDPIATNTNQMNLLVNRQKQHHRIASSDINSHAISPLNMSKFQDAQKIMKRVDHFNTTIGSNTQPQTSIQQHALETFNGTTLQTGVQQALSSNYKTTMMSPIRGNMVKTWFEKSANQAYREFNSSHMYAMKKQNQNEDLAVHTSTAAGSALQGANEALISPLQKIYGNGYLHRTGIIHSSQQKNRRGATAASNGSRQMASGGMMQYHKGGIFSETASPSLRDPLAYTMSHKTAGPMSAQRTALGKMANNSMGRRQRASYKQRQSLAEILQVGGLVNPISNATNAARRQTPQTEKRFSRQELAFVLDQKEKYKWIKMHTNPPGDYDDQQNGPPQAHDANKINGIQTIPRSDSGQLVSANTEGMSSDSRANQGVTATVIASHTSGNDSGGGTPAPLINIQTRDKSQQEQQQSQWHKRRQQQRRQQALQAAQSKKKGASLSQILNLSNSGNQTGAGFGGHLSDTTQVNSTNMKSNSQVEHYGGRKSLFDNTSRDIVSLKRQVPLARVREFLAGSGKNSENSHHFDRNLAQYFRPKQLGLGANRKRQTRTRNLNNSMTEKVTSTVGGVAHDEAKSMNRSQVIPSQQPTMQKSKFATESALTAPQIQIERDTTYSLGQQQQDDDENFQATFAEKQKLMDDDDDDAISVSGIGPAGILISQNNYNSLDNDRDSGNQNFSSPTKQRSAKNQSKPMKINLPNMTRSIELQQNGARSDSDRSSQWGPGFEDLPPAHKQMLRDLRSDSNREEFAKRQEDDKRKYQKYIKLMNNNMLSKWIKQQNKLKGGRGSNQGPSRAGDDGSTKEADSAMNTKALIKSNLDERMGYLIEALFNFWKRKHAAVPAQKFYKRMTTFGLAPSLKFIEEITTIQYANRPKQTTQHHNNTPAGQQSKSKKKSQELTQNGSQSQISHRSRFDKSIRLGDSIKNSKSGQASARGDHSRTPKSRNAMQEQKSTICSAADRAFTKDGNEICKWVKLATFKSIYGHGTQVKFVKLLLLLLKKQIERFIENKNAQAKCHQNQQNQQRKKITKQASNQSVDSGINSDRKFKKPQKHALVADLEDERKRARDRNQEHKFYKIALNCQQERQICSQMVYGFRVSQRLRAKNQKRNNLQSNEVLNESVHPQIRSMSTGYNPPPANASDNKTNLRYSLQQYEELIHHIWSHQLDTECKNEIPEGKFFRFLRDQKIITEKKQLDEMYKQCLFAKKGEEVSVGATVPFTLYQKLFAKPLMIIGMENALSLIEQVGSRDQHQGTLSHSASPARKDQNSGQPAGIEWPEMDTSSLGQTMAVVSFHRKYMKNVFTSDELDQYTYFKQEAHRVKKKFKERQFLDPSINPIQEKNAMDPLQQLEAYRASKKGLEVLQPYGIDKQEAIKVMSYYGDIWLAKKKRTKDQLKRKIENEITLELVNQKRRRATRRSELRSQGIPVEPTTSESESDEENEADQNGKGGQNMMMGGRFGPGRRVTKINSRKHK